jgi:hypothetical protein
MSEQEALDLEALGSISRRLAAALFAAVPEAQRRATMFRAGETDGASLFAPIPSPTGDDARGVQVWVDEGDPSIGFGPGHTHHSPDDAGIAEVVELCRAMLDDKLIIIQDVGGEYDGHADWLDLREPDALEEALTGRYSTGRAILKSWSGQADREVGLTDL